MLLDKATHFYTVFSSLESLVNLKITESRKGNLAGKRREKRNQSLPMPPLTSQVVPVWVGPPAPPQSVEETLRITSISDPSKSSTGTQLFHATQEQESEYLANLFCKVALSALFRRNPTLDWVTGRPEIPVLQWRNRYLAIYYISHL